MQSMRKFTSASAQRSVLARRPVAQVRAFMGTQSKEKAPVARKITALKTKEETLAEVSTQFDRWNSALATLDPKKVAALYAEDGVLLPTVSNKVRTSPEEIEAYFTNFLTLKPQGKINECNVRMLADDTAINSGVYTFDVVKDNKPAKVQARYSFTYKRLDDGQWYIVDHHSSGMPEVIGNPELEEVANQFELWNASLQTGDPKKVAAMYGPGAVLLPTVSNKVRTTTDEIADYFTAFLKLKPFGKIDASNVRILAKDLAINSGVYTFKLNKDGKESLVQARYSFTYKKFDGKWMIIDHHSSAMPESEEKKLAEITALFDKWNAALQTGDPAKVAACYAPSGVLLPTVSNQVRTTPAEIQDYFVAFLKLKPNGKIDDANVRVLGPDTAINSGVYTFDLVVEGAPTQVQARYSFTYKKIGGEWLIIDHHSSGMPEKVEKAVKAASDKTLVSA
ncbi:hypothetical protein FOA52_015197 [Chlamydomonas sp. UWO 241]|nr:hypothetical protein FOA52_015197 [Chlamydomonas sp. UWO 241]